MEYERGLVAQYDAIHKRLMNGNGHSKKIIPLPTNPHPQANALATVLARIEALASRIEDLEEQESYLKKRITILEIKNEWKPNLIPHNSQGNPQRKSEITIDDIFQLVATKERLSATVILSHQRFQRVCFARNVIYYLSCMHTQRSFPQIGAFMHRDHTTVLKLKNNFNERRKVDAELDAKLSWYENEIGKLIEVKNGDEVVNSVENLSTG